MRRLNATIGGANVMLIAAGLIAACLAAPADAQLSAQAKGPIDITADQAEVVQSKCMAIWRGAAEAIQDSSRIRADSITVYSKVKAAHGANDPPACGSGAERIVADGNVYYVTPDRNARGDHAVYTSADDQIVMTGSVIVVQGDNVARGDKLIIDVASHQARMLSDVTGAGKAGRVRGVYFPDQPPTAAAPR
jgi:lipopolysaccharide export system protein LptA